MACFAGKMKDLLLGDYPGLSLKRVFGNTPHISHLLLFIDIYTYIYIIHIYIYIDVIIIIVIIIVVAVKVLPECGRFIGFHMNYCN